MGSHTPCGTRLDPNSYVEVLFEGADHPKAGQHVMVVLRDDPNTDALGEYRLLQGALSRFTQGEDDVFHRNGEFVSDRIAAGWETTTDVAAVVDAIRPLR